MLSDYKALSAFLRIDIGNASEDAYAGQLVQLADRVFHGFVKRKLETTTYTGYYSGNNEIELALRQRPVHAAVFSGTLTNGMATFTGMSCLTGYGSQTNGTTVSGTDNLFVGMPAAIAASSGTTAKLATLPINTTIASIQSATQVTLSNNATVGGTFNVVFGLDVYQDLTGWFGDAPGVFGATTQLMMGQNYILKRSPSSPDLESKSGLIQRLVGGPIGAGWWGFGDPYTDNSSTPAITASRLPGWVYGIGNIKVVHTAGVGVGATPPASLIDPGGTLPAKTTIPWELTEAVNMIASYIRLVTPRGAPLDTTSLNDAAQQQVSAAMKAGEPLLGTVAEVVRHWRELAA